MKWCDVTMIYNSKINDKNQIDLMTATGKPGNDNSIGFNNQLMNQCKCGNLPDCNV
jgi:hypothetical protein